MRRRIVYSSIFLFLVLITFLSVVFGIGIGSVYIPPQVILKILYYQLLHLLGRKIPQTLLNSPSYIIVVDLREPRTLAAAVGGAALAVAGLIFQVLFRNPIVGPYVLGISSGATLMVGIVILLGSLIGITTILPHTIILAALLGSYLVTAIVLLAATVVRSVVTLLVIGLMVGYMCGAATNILITLAQSRQVHAFIMWTLGSFSAITWSGVLWMTTLCLPLMIVSILLSKPLNLLLLGEDYAKTMGLEVRKFRIIIVGLASTLTAIVTAYAGPVGFIGVAIPHLARILTRTSNNFVLVPVTALVGASVTVICDVLARGVIIPNIELPINAVTSLFGAPLIIGLLLKRRMRL